MKLALIHKVSLAISVCAATLVSTVSAGAGTLENLERERAIVLNELISAELTPGERTQRLEIARSRLVDLERMVMRDQSLRGQSTPDVQRAFTNYDMTFLVHASIEKDRAVVDHWFEQMGLSTSALMLTKAGRRR